LVYLLLKARLIIQEHKKSVKKCGDMQNDLMAIVCTSSVP